MSSSSRVVIAVFPDVDLLDVTGPAEVFALAGGAFVAAVVGAVTAVMTDAPRSSPLFPAACMVAAPTCVVAADTVDAAGEQRAADIATQGFHENGCDYPAQVCSATPGWFTW